MYKDPAMLSFKITLGLSYWQDVFVDIDSEIHHFYHAAEFPYAELYLIGYHSYVFVDFLYSG